MDGHMDGIDPPLPSQGLADGGETPLVATYIIGLT